MEIDFSYTNKMVRNLLEIEKNRGIISGSSLNEEDRQYLKDKAIINSAYFGCKFVNPELETGDVEQNGKIKNYVNLLYNFKSHEDLYSNLLIVFNNQLTKDYFPEEFTFKTEKETIEVLVDFIKYNKEFPDVIIIGIACYVLNKIRPFRHMNAETINAIGSFLLYFKKVDPNQYLNINHELFINRMMYEDCLRNGLTVWLEFFTEIVANSMELLKKEVISLESDFDLSKKEIMILEHLEENGCIRNRDVQEILSISSKTAHSYLDRLLKKNIIQREGKGRSIHYTLNKSG